MKRLKKFMAGLLATVTLASLVSTPVFAEQGYNYVTGDEYYRQPVPQCYNVVRTVNNLGDYEEDNLYFNNPQDLFIDNYDNIYIVDTGNNRVVRMNSDFETTGVFYGPDTAFNKPEGIYVDDDGDMYLADTGNKRIVHMDPDGNLVEIFTNPESSLNTGTSFTPSKLIVSKTGYLYVVRGENIMAIDGNGEFRGYYGQTNIGYDLTEALMRIFASDEQQAFVTKRLASSYINLTLGDDGMIYATSMEREEGEIKKLNSVGTNIYRKYKTVGNSINNPITTFIEKKVLKSVVASSRFRFGEYFDDDGYYMEPIFTDICVDNDGIVTVIEQLNGKVYQYDQDGNMLVAFGGNGESTGTFSRASAIDVDSNGNIMILDRINCNIQVFEPTEFINYVHQATTAFNDGDYTGSYELWNKVLDVDENYDLAHVGIAKSLYKEGEYKLAMEESEKVENRDVYTTAFDEYKYVVLRAYFVPIIVAALVIIIVFILLVKLFKKKSKEAYWDFIEHKDRNMKVGKGILISFYSIIHPCDTIEGISYNKKRLNMAVPFIMLIAAYVVRMAYLYIVHFPLASIELSDVNPFFEAVKLWIIPLTWVPASFLATSISGGESKAKEITFVSAMSYAPFIVIHIPLMFLSHLMSKSQSSWYGVFSAIAYIMMFIILFIGLMILNSYTFGKTVGMTFLTAGMMIVIWLVCLLCYILSGRLIQFIVSIVNEFQLNFL